MQPDLLQRQTQCTGDGPRHDGIPAQGLPLLLQGRSAPTYEKRVLQLIKPDRRSAFSSLGEQELIMRRTNAPDAGMETVVSMTSTPKP